MARVAEPTNVDSWFLAYKQKKRTVRLGEDGSLQIIDKSNPDAQPKIIPHNYGIDAYRVLNYNEHPELRAAAVAKLTENEVAFNTKIETAYAELQVADSEYISAIESWERNKTVENTLAVGRAQRKLAKAEEMYTDVKYPYRSIVSRSEIPRILIDYRTKDERKHPFNIQLATYEKTVPADRTIGVDRT